MLDSIAGAAGLLIVNDNAPEPSPHAQTLAAQSVRPERRVWSSIARRFAGFAAARNVCMRIHAERRAGDWVAFVDADEVHGAERSRRSRRNLAAFPREYDFVDGYTWHFFQSFEYYTSIERRMMFFRFNARRALGRRRCTSDCSD